MGIEPLNSAMTFQAQPAAQPVVKAEAAMEGQQAQYDAPQVDAKTLSVSKTQDGNANNGGEQNGASKDGSQNGQVSNEMIRDAMKELTKKSTSVQAEFGIHEETNRITIKMVDKKTKEVIKELPPEKMLDMIAKVWEYAGLVVDEKR